MAALGHRAIPILCDSCGTEFVDEAAYRSHCYAHIEAKIAAARALRKICLPTETWTEVLPGCGRKSLALRVSLVGRLFDAIARPLIHGREDQRRILPALRFFHESYEPSKPVLVRGVKRLPIAEVPPPTNVVGFACITFGYFDVQVALFVHSIRHLMASDVRVEVCSPNAYVSTVIARRIAVLRQLLALLPHQQHSLIALKIDAAILAAFGARPLARLLTTVRELFVTGRYEESTNWLLPRCDAFVPVLAEWLHTPHHSGAPKLLQFYSCGNKANFAELAHQAKERFSSDIEDGAVVAFSLRISKPTGISWRRQELPFTVLRNEHTGQRLTLRQHNDTQVLSILRCDAQTDEQEAALEAQMVALERDSWHRDNRLVIDTSQIGELPEVTLEIDEIDESNPNEEEDIAGPSNAKKVKMG